MCTNVSPLCMYVHHMYAWCLLKSEWALDHPELVLRATMSVLRTKPTSSAKGASVLHYPAASPAPRLTVCMCAYLCVLVYTSTHGAKRQCQIPWSCSYRRLWSVWCGSWKTNRARAVCARDCWAISPTPARGFLHVKQTLMRRCYSLDKIIASG